MKEIDTSAVLRRFLVVEYDDMGEFVKDLEARRSEGWEPVGSSYLYGAKRRMKYMHDTEVPCDDD